MNKKILVGLSLALLCVSTFGLSNESPHGSAASGKKAQNIDLKSIKVEKAPGPKGITIAALYAQKEALKDKEVWVRGKITKFLPGIMKRNWVHLSDGSGSLSEKNFDLTVTTLDNAAVGDIVLVKGKLQVGKKLDAGYFFPLIIEDAKLEDAKLEGAKPKDANLVK